MFAFQAELEPYRPGLVYGYLCACWTEGSFSDSFLVSVRKNNRLFDTERLVVVLKNVRLPAHARAAVIGKELVLILRVV